MPSTVHQLAIQRGSEKLGGFDRLAFHLSVPTERVKAWAEALEPLPAAYLLKIADLLYEDDLKALREMQSAGAAEHVSDETAASPK